MAETPRRRALDRRGQTAASGGQAGRGRLYLGPGRRDGGTQRAQPGLQHASGRFSALGLGLQHRLKPGLAPGQGLDFGAPVVPGAFGGEQLFAVQRAEPADPDHLGLTVGKALGLGLQRRRHGAHQYGGPHGVHGLVGGDQQRRRRASAHHLQGGQQPALPAPCPGQLGHQRRLAGAQLAQPGPLAGDDGVVLSDRGAQFGQLALQPGDLAGGLGGLRAQAQGAGALVTELGLQPADLGRRRRLARDRRHRQGNQAQAEDQDRGAHQSR